MHEFRSMGCDIAVEGATETEIAAVERLFERRDRTFSRFAAYTELNRVNGRAGRPMLVSADFADMVELALTAADQTNGLVDPTLGRALEAAGYDRDFALLADDPRPAGAPAPSKLPAVRLHGRILAISSGTRLDLSGVVKAQTVDDALAILGGNGFVSAGGDLAARGGLSVALPGGGAVHLLLGALATSGSDRRRWRRARTVQHHLIDPRTGLPARSPWQQVTVCARTCCGADVAAKAAFLLGHDGPDWLDGRALPGRFRTADGVVAVNRSWQQSVAEHPCI